MSHSGKIFASLALLALAAAPALAVSADVACAPAALILRHVTIMDASGRWDDQDILIEDGQISAVGSDLQLGTANAVTEIDGRGAIVRPRPDETVRVFIRTSTAAPSASTMIILPGAPADLIVSPPAAGLTGRSGMEIRGGRIAGDRDVCLAG